MHNNIAFEIKKNMVQEALAAKLRHHFGKTLEDATKYQLYNACAMVIRDEVMEMWTRSQEEIENQRCKKLYYLSVEFLMGRTMGNNLMNLMEKEVYREAFKELGINLNELEDTEPDAGLGNGGLGRLAACFLDSLTTLNLPAVGCGIRYEYGLFKQRIMDGYQIEMPDPWLEYGNVWEIYKPEEQEEVKFGGEVKEYWEEGRMRVIHEGYHSVMAVPYDVPITGCKSDLVNSLRLWSARSPKHMDMGLFSKGDYVKAMAEKELAEAISKVLYPEDNHYEGKALRLKQYYFFVSATIQYIVRNHKLQFELYELPDKVAVHINDTHPALAIPELMRILMDQEGLDWDTAWDITTRTFAYTNHTIMGEALERWPVTLFKGLLPRIYIIVNEINDRYCRKLWGLFPGQWDRISNMAIIAYDEIRMANLCISACYSVNGVSELHTNILKNQVFRDFYQIHPQKFCSITNGVTQRRWLLHANPGLAKLITDTIGDEWILNAQKLKEIEKYSDDPAFRNKYRKIKEENKEKLCKYILEHNNIKVDPMSIFDVQIKRLHEYKRQLLNAFYIMYLYNRILKNPTADIYPRTFIFGAKASPGYYRAKLIIKLINSIADRVNGDKSIKEKIKVVFLEDYRVSLAEKIIPAAEVSKQISTAGKEASGTGNMKLMLNGALTVGTLDGANIEIRDAVGHDNIFIFGLRTENVLKYQQYGGYHSRDVYEQNHTLKEILDQLINGFIEPEETMLFKDIFNSLLYGNDGGPDPYMVLMDFESFIHVQERVEREYRQPETWWNKAVINTANAGLFSSDRSILEYNDRIWKLDKINL